MERWIITTTARGVNRACDRSIEEASQWLERYRQVWEGNFERLDSLLEELKLDDQKVKQSKQ